ncbi:MAG: hypothetical protein COW03_11025 [Cytophagales bacterium CG12_big_fil_rev_8_21_14_0_65_40_12]|nr:MAG: hypothetical protein COW03_11025 [Cytophagales bacterium CG12_big_fil_rev_8_21_14_0_65_40_12]PIW05647.1 MAG: hypothetical protein COW40_04170 [Cytophagales bacterium CG17_big_fil_post_rev_8_21_14_2_50_40_13]
MNSNSNQWFDRSLGILGVLLTIVPIAKISGVLESINSIEYLIYVEFFIGVLILYIVFKRLREGSFVKELPRERFFTQTAAGLKDIERIIVNNPDQSEDSKNLVQSCVDLDITLSIVGEANKLNQLIASSGNGSGITKFLNVSKSSSSHPFFILLNAKNNNVQIAILRGKTAIQLTLKGKELYNEIKNLIEDLFLSDESAIVLNNFTNPVAFLEVIEKEKRKFSDNFNDLKSGFISFYGTEVQNAQSGWLESDKFNSIRTLDLTSNPGLLLNRERYNDANRSFVDRGGTIKRVFMIERKRLENIDFKNNLIKVIQLQISLGVNIGLMFLNELALNEKQDFILYDSFVAFVEERQANSDYTFGKSTAYFSKIKIQFYEELFERVWAGQGYSKNPRQNVKELLKQ